MLTVIYEIFCVSSLTASMMISVVSTNPSKLYISGSVAYMQSEIAPKY